MTQHRNTRAAFSLMELLAVVAILGIIAALVVPRFVRSSDVTKEATCHHSRAEFNIAVERYYLHTGVWPVNDLSDIKANTDCFPSGIPKCPVSDQPYRLDSTTHRVVGHAGTSDHSP